MKKELSQQEKRTLTTELVYQGERSGVVGGYCEPGFPLYYVNDEMAAMLGYDSAAELTAAIGAQSSAPSGGAGPGRPVLRGGDL